MAKVTAVIENPQAEEQEVIEPELVEQDDVVEPEEVASEVVEPEEQIETPQAHEDHEPEGLTVTIGDEEPEPEKDSAVIRDLRQRYRELQKRNKELEQQHQTQQPQTIVVGNKPTLEECGWDTDAYEAKLLEWQSRKAKAESQQQEAQRQQEEINKRWSDKLAEYGTKKAALKVADYDDAEENVQASLSQMQIAIIMQGARDSALSIYALGKNKAKLNELAAIKDPVQFAVAIGELGKEINVKPRKMPPAPETRVKSGSAPAKSSGETLDALRAQAAKTGDYSQVLAYKAKMKKA